MTRRTKLFDRMSGGSEHTHTQRLATTQILQKQCGFHWRQRRERLPANAGPRGRPAVQQFSSYSCRDARLAGAWPALLAFLSRFHPAGIEPSPLCGAGDGNNQRRVALWRASSGGPGRAKGCNLQGALPPALASGRARFWPRSQATSVEFVCRVVYGLVVVVDVVAVAVVADGGGDVVLKRVKA